MQHVWGGRGRPVLYPMGTILGCEVARDRVRKLHKAAAHVRRVAQSAQAELRSVGAAADLALK